MGPFLTIVASIIWIVALLKVIRFRKDRPLRNKWLKWLASAWVLLAVAIIFGSHAWLMPTTAAPAATQAAVAKPSQFKRGSPPEPSPTAQKANKSSGAQRQKTAAAHDEPTAKPAPTEAVTSTNTPSANSGSFVPPHPSEPNSWVSDPLQGVYHPYRLVIQNPWVSVTGTVSKVRHEQDGDYHVDVELDPQFKDLINQDNISQQNGALVTEVIPADQGRVRIPSVGVQVLVTGPYVRDTDHGWMEIHPARYVDFGVANPPPRSPGTLTPSPTPAPIPQPASSTVTSLVVSASVSNPSPADYSTETIFVKVTDQNRRPVSGATIQGVAHYKTSDHPFQTGTGSDGTASAGLRISRATPGYRVEVDVTATYGNVSESGQTSFTPSRP